LTGKFLHITDIHPDPHYVSGSRVDNSCHSGKGKKHDGTGKFGAPISPCDSPMTLADETFKWIKENLIGKIDFIIWTGDNVRHDNDNRHPRTELQIFELNEYIASKFIELLDADERSEHPEDEKDDDTTQNDHVFSVIPSLGNNDVFPHNLFAPGPTLQTRELYRIWDNFVPQDQMHIFGRGAYYLQEVIPNKLAVISLNTLYWFVRNPLVDTCDKHTDPGFQQLEWLGIVLKELRSRGMKAWLSGHVPAIEKNYETSCYDKLALWKHEYRDVIIGSVYGHMNMDHFAVTDSQASWDRLHTKTISNSADSKDTIANIKGFKYESELEIASFDNFGLNKKFASELDELEFNEIFEMSDPSNGKVAYLDTVRYVYSKVKNPRNWADIYGSRYSVENINPSVIPNYFPSLRVYEYNTTGLIEEDNKDELNKPKTEETQTLNRTSHRSWEDIYQELVDKSMPQSYPSEAEYGPAYLSQTFTPIRYVQYYANITAFNLGEREFSYEVEYISDEGDQYNSQSGNGLTIKNYLMYARKLSFSTRAGKRKLQKKISESDAMWEAYLNKVFVSTGYED
ncbi:Endopolyphosphatase, partial [Nadsonia fulvescens var. elongata DSM 6958]